MKIKLLKAKLRTGGKTQDQIASDYEDDITEKEIQDWIKAYNLIDRKEIIVADIRKDRFTLISWLDEDDETFREFIYQAEQDDLFGAYTNAREKFLRDWKDGVYEPGGSLGFDENDVEIMEELEKKLIKSSVVPSTN